MIGLDTNMVIRYLVQDDAEQSKIAHLHQEHGATFTLTFDQHAAAYPFFKLAK